MIIYKCNEKIFKNLNWLEKDGFYFTSINSDLSLLNLNIFQAIDKFDCVQADKNLFVYFKCPIPSDIKKKYVRGEPVLLADGKEWTIRTIADVNYKFTITENNGEFIQTAVPSDPLFMRLLEYSEKIKAGVDYAELIDVIADCLAPNYYLNKNIMLALGLIDTNSIEKIIRTIYRFDELQKLGDDFFRAGTVENEAGQSNCSGRNHNLSDQETVIEKQRPACGGDRDDFINGRFETYT